VGMYPDTGKSPISLKEFKNLSFVADMIYNPAKTALLLEAEELNIPFVNGLLMLVAQAKKSAESFSGQKIPQSRIDEITSKLSFEMKNIVLIGMPGCGKTTVGEIIAKKLGRDFIDTDRIIEEKAGMTIPEIFKTLGEGHFRALETEVIKEVGKSCSKVISTGGGAVKNLQNKNHLRQNGYVVFIDRDINLLETKGRPLSENAGALKKMYRERFPLYLGFCDISVDGNGEPSDVAEKITAGLL
jgi:shikimate dehydrogenase